MPTADRRGQERADRQRPTQLDIASSEPGAAGERTQTDVAALVRSRKLPAPRIHALQRAVGNATVTGLVGAASADAARAVAQPAVQRDPLPAATAGAGDVNAAYRQARGIVDAAPAADLLQLRRDVAVAMERYNVASGLVFTLRLGDQTVPGFRSDWLNDLYGATDAAARREFDRARATAAAQQRAAEAERQAVARRVAVTNYLHDLDVPVGRSGAPAGRRWMVRSPSGGVLDVTDAQLHALREAAVADLRRLCGAAENWLITAGQSHARRSGAPWEDPNTRYLSNQGAASEALAAALGQLGSAGHGSLERAFGDVTAAVIAARTAQEAASAAAVDTTTVEHVIAGLRLVRDTCIAIETTAITIATGGTAGLLAGAAAGAAMAGAATAEDQWVDTGRIDWGEVAASAVGAGITAAAGGRLAPGLTQALQRTLVDRLVVVMTSPVVRQRLSAYTRASVIAAVERQVIPRLTNLAVDRLLAGAATAGTSTVRGRTGDQIAAAVLDQLSLRHLVLSAVTSEASILAGRLPVRRPTGRSVTVGAGSEPPGPGSSGEDSGLGEVNANLAHMRMRDQNCVNAAVATDAHLGGRRATAVPGTGEELHSILRELQRLYRGPARSMSVAEIRGELLADGAGTRGIVIGRYPGSRHGHAFNARNHNGVVEFIDGQVNRSIDPSRFEDVRFIRTEHTDDIGYGAAGPRSRESGAPPSPSAVRGRADDPDATPPLGTRLPTGGSAEWPAGRPAGTPQRETRPDSLLVYWNHPSGSRYNPLVEFHPVEGGGVYIDHISRPEGFPLSSAEMLREALGRTTPAFLESTNVINQNVRDILSGQRQYARLTQAERVQAAETLVRRAALPFAQMLGATVGQVTLSTGRTGNLVAKLHLAY